MKILLLGGTGAMGKDLAEILAKDNNDVYVTSRKNRKSNTIKYINGNARDIEFLENILQGSWDVVIDFMIYKVDEFKNRVNLLLSSTSQYIFISSSRVYANEKILTENSQRLMDLKNFDEEYLQTDEYAISKAKQENILFHNDNKNWTIVRPYITFNEERFQLGNFEKEIWLYRILNNKTLILCDEMMNKVTTLSSGYDIALILSKLVGNRKAIGTVLNVTNDSFRTWKSIIDLYINVIEEVTGNKIKIIYQNKNKYVKWNRGKYQIEYDRLYDRKFNITKLKTIIGEISFKDLESSLKQSLKSFLKKPKFNYIDWKDQATIDRQTNEFTSLKNIHGIKSKIKYLIYRYLKK